MSKIMIKFKSCWFEDYIYAEIWELIEEESYEYFKPIKPSWKLLQAHPFYPKTGKVCKPCYYYKGRDMGFGNSGYSDRIREAWLKQNGI